MENNALLKYFNNDTLAAEVWTNKYKYKDEVSPSDMHRRLAREFARIEEKYQIDETPEKINLLSRYGRLRKPLTEERIFELFDRFNDIIPQGSIMSSLGTDKIASLSNCFVVGQPHDSYSGILQKDEELVQLMKRRGGVGIDLSTLRPSGTKVTNAAKTSTGAVSFMDRYSNSTREVAQGGRRGALMLTIDCRHPDVLDFINSKKDRTKITGANISVMLRDDFMEAVKNDEDYLLRWPCDTEIPDYQKFDNFDYNTLILYEEQDKGDEGYLSCQIKKIKAKELYNQIVENAWENAEPGQIFIDKHWNYSPDGVYKQYRGVTTNPCGEIFMQMYDACRLMCINFFNLIDDAFNNGELNKDKLYTLAYEQQRLSDDLVDLEIEAIDKIISKIKSDKRATDTELNLWTNIREVARSGRRTGNGFTALGDMLAALSLKYDSEESKKIIEEVMQIKLKAELDCTVDLSILRGSFEGANPDLEFGKDMKSPANDWYKFILEEFPEQALRMFTHCRRNVSFSTVAPTGTVSIMTQTSSGMEPLYKAYYTRRVKVNPGEKNARVDFVDQSGDSWMEYPVLHPKFEEWCDINKMCTGTIENIQSAFKESPWYGSEADDIDWKSRIEIQSIIQKYTTHSISSTINLPEKTTKEEVAEIYQYAWDKGLKGVTVYRNNSRTGVLIDSQNKQQGFAYKDAVKRPRHLIADGYITKVKGEEYIVLIGLLDGKPYEVFSSRNKWNLPSKFACEIIKKNKTKYEVIIKDILTIENFTSEITDEEAAITRLISTSLRHGVSPEFIAAQLNKTTGAIVNFDKSIARILNKYSANRTLTEECPECQGELIRIEGCKKCKQCTYSAC